MESSIQKVIKGLGLYFYKLAETSSDVMWVRTADLESLLFVSKSYTEIWGDTRENLYAEPSNWIQSIHPCDRKRISALWNRIAQATTKPESETYEYSILDAKKNQLAITETLFPIYDGGDCVGIAGVSRKQEPTSQPSALQPDRMTALITQTQPLVFWEKNACGQFTSIQTQGQPGHEPVHSSRPPGRSYHDCTHPDDLPKLTASALQAAVREKGSLKTPIEITYRQIKPGQSMAWMTDIFLPTLDETGSITGFFGYTQDKTRDVVQKRELSQAIKSADAANKTKSDFLAMLSHELRTPLNAVLGMAQILNTTPLSGSQRDQLDVIMSSGKSLLNSLNDLLDYAKIDLGSLEFSFAEGSLTRTIHEVVDDFKNEHIMNHPGIQVDLNFEENLPDKLVIDKQKLQQILINLLLNALRFTASGVITIRVKCLQRNTSEAVICITVEDSGSGIQKNELHDILSQFSEQKTVYIKPHNDLGLGLVIVRELVERLGGSLAVSSEPGYGSQFSCILPIKTTQATPKSIPQKQEGSAQLSSLRVFVVEDNPINQKIIITMLEQQGCYVTLAQTGEEAVTKMDGSYDLIFMDIGLPDIDGFETTRRIKKEHRNKSTPIIAMTAHVFSHDRDKCFQVGMDEVIAKPILKEDLINILKRYTKDSYQASRESHSLLSTEG